MHLLLEFRPHQKLKYYHYLLGMLFIASYLSW